MESTQHLENHLKRLRLPAMNENLAVRVREAKENDLGFIEFLSLLVQDEIASRDTNNLSKRLRTGGFSSRLTFEHFDWRFNSEAMPSQTIRDLAACHFVERNQNLILCGPPGIGKTHIAQAIGHEVCRRGYEAMFAKTHKLLEDLRDELYPRRRERLWKRAVSVKVLILDDFGFRRYDGKEAELLYALSDERLGEGTTILTSNRPADDWYGVFPDPVIGGAILDRFASGAVKIIVERARSYRREGSKKTDAVDSVSEKTIE